MYAEIFSTSNIFMIIPLDTWQKCYSPLLQ